MNMQEATITKWMKQPGDAFKQGDVLYELETEKVTNEVEAPADGILLEVLVAEGEDCQVGDSVCRIQTDG